MANKFNNDREDDTGLVPPGTGVIEPQTDNNGELNEEELDDVSGGVTSGINSLIQVTQAKAGAARQSLLSSSQAQAEEQQLKKQQQLNAKLSLPL